jgi:hypothetical protein
MTDLGSYEALLNPKRQPPLWAQHAIDGLSWGLPAFAALFSTVGGITALCNESVWAAGLGIAGGIVAAAGVIFTNWASRIRDDRLVEARSLGALGMDMASSALDRLPPYF